MKDLDQLKRESADDLRGARDRREQRDARAQRDVPILDAFDRMLRGEPVPYMPGPRHPPKLEAVPEPSAPATRVVNVRRDAAAVKLATAAGLYVYIGRDRSGRSKWGNPFTWKPGTLAEFVVPKDQVLARYEAWLHDQPHLMAALGELRGKVLGCWCKPGPCHGDILARLADEVIQ